jgi:hypothetical protein
MAAKKRGRRTPAKKSRRRLVSPKFVAITAASMPEHPRLPPDAASLFALDESGGVWQYSFNSSVWIELAPGRQPNFVHDEET